MREADWQTEHCFLLFDGAETNDSILQSETWVYRRLLLRAETQTQNAKNEGPKTPGFKCCVEIRSIVWTLRSESNV